MHVPRDEPKKEVGNVHHKEKSKKGVSKERIRDGSAENVEGRSYIVSAGVRVENHSGGDWLGAYLRLGPNL